MSVMIEKKDATQVMELLVVYSKKNAFVIDEYADVSAVYNKVKTYLVKAQAGDEVGELSLLPGEVNYLVRAIDVCATRVPMEMHNYKPVGELFERLSKLVLSEEEKAAAPASSAE